ncbi:hypothetical protein [Nocardiopsis valliformis]|uniref:hypothetical protein n=1 Tax=Nocardiopsis valliformis TaxID=239974 RepID=UPI00034C42FA
MNSCSRNRTRRSLQGGLAFIAFGALSIAAAVPAHADTGEGSEDDGDLARTGVPVVGLIAAGAAVTAGGGAAAYLARRRKNTAENSES